MAKKAGRRSRKAAPRTSRPAPADHVPPLHPIPPRPRGSLIIIGGNENKDGHRPILEQVARAARRGTLLIATFASEEPQQQWEEYREVFRSMGLKRIAQLDARNRVDLLSTQLDTAMSASAIFFTGGDQLKITSRFGGTQICEVVRRRYADGALIAGTSSGAAVMSETMLVAGGEDRDSHSGKEDVRMAPGLGFLPAVIVDQHFAERGRIGRLLGAIAQNPRLLGLGIDEDTAVCFSGHRKFSVIGSGAVYVIDARNMSFTDVAEDTTSTSSIHNIALHVLAAADEFDLSTRMPVLPPAIRKRTIKKQEEDQLRENDATAGGQRQ